MNNPAICKIRAVIHFPQAKNVGAAEIDCELHTAVYSQNVF
jgi:hypothetical protein